MHIPQQVTREQLKGSYSEGEALAIYNEVKKTGQWHTDRSVSSLLIFCNI